MLGRILALGLFVALVPGGVAEAAPQIGSDPARGIGQGAAGRIDSLAVAPIEVSAAIETAARADGRAEALARFESVLADRLGTTLAGTRKFTMVARDRLVGPLLDEQAFAGTALVNLQGVPCWQKSTLQSRMPLASMRRVMGSVTQSHEVQGFSLKKPRRRR